MLGFTWNTERRYRNVLCKYNSVPIPHTHEHTIVGLQENLWLWKKSCIYSIVCWICFIPSALLPSRDEHITELKQLGNDVTKLLEVWKLLKFPRCIRFCPQLHSYFNRTLIRDEMTGCHSSLDCTQWHSPYRNMTTSSHTHKQTDAVAAGQQIRGRYRAK